jgi:hypothetical protein
MTEYTPTGETVTFTVPDYVDVADGPQLAKDLADDVAAQFSVPGRAETLSNKTLGSDLAAGSNKITGLADPTLAQDAATKNWVETSGSSFVAQASTQATNSASSATASASSAAASASSAAAALVSEGNAATSSASASTSAASASADAASTAADVISTNADVVSTNADVISAAASAAAALASQGAASTSESNAASSASSAAAAQVAAANSAAAAATALDNFTDRYLGSLSSFPTTDLDGDPLVSGALFYLNTGTAEQIGMYVYDGSGWLKASAASVASIVTYEYTATASQTAFTGNDDNGVALSFTGALIQVFLNGVLLSPGDDYTTSTNTVTLASGAALNDVLVVVAFASFQVADTYTTSQADSLFATKTELTSVEALALLGL